MELLIVRHGIAEDAERSGKTDDERALTPRGVERTTRAATGLARIADRPETILASPKRRAMQTAGILGEAFDLSPQTCDLLAEEDIPALLTLLRERTEHRLMLVGHEPTLSQLIERLCAGERIATPGFIDMKKAACALVEGPIGRDEPPGPRLLRWLIPPRVLRTLIER